MDVVETCEWIALAAATNNVLTYLRIAGSSDAQGFSSQAAMRSESEEKAAGAHEARPAASAGAGGENTGSELIEAPDAWTGGAVTSDASGDPPCGSCETESMVAPLRASKQMLQRYIPSPMLMKPKFEQSKHGVPNAVVK